MSSTACFGVATLVGLCLVTGNAASQSASWQCRAQYVEACFKHHGRLSSQNGIALRIWLIGTTRMVALENDAQDLPPVVRKYLDMTSPDHSYIYGDYTICPVEPDVPGRLRRVCVTGGEKLVAQRVDGSSAAFRLESTWPADGARPPAQIKANEAVLDPAIPPARASEYQKIQDGAQWLNPRVLVRAKTVDVKSSALTDGGVTVPLEELPQVLVGLPVSAWPYGRVVLGSELALRSPGDTPAIEQNRREVTRILAALHVAVT